MKHIQKLTVAAVALTAAVVAQASIPTIDDDSVSVTKRSSSLVIGYELKGAPAVVTVDFQTNGVSIGEANFTNVDGDVNRLVTAGSGKQIVWKFRESWPDHKTDDFSVKLTAWPVNDPPDYLVVAYDAAQKTGVARYYVSTNALPYGGLANRLYATNNVVFRRIHAAGREYTMRCESLLSKSGNLRDDFRRVRLTRDYYMAVYETTAGHYKTLRGEASQQAQKTIYYGGVVDEYPVQGYNSHSAIRWDGETYGWPQGGHYGDPSAKPWIKYVRDRFAFAFDLPTEAEWEFACRAGSDRMYYYSDWLPNNAQQSDINVWCWNKTNSADGPHPVGLQPPNAWGLYDMHGNVSEICLDYFDNTDGWIDRMSVSGGADNSDAHTDPVGIARPTTQIVTGKTQEQTRVKRGGDYAVDYNRQMCGVRDYSYGGYTECGPGMRLVCPAIAVK